jgi:hypothetical protein
MTITINPRKIALIALTLIPAGSAAIAINEMMIALCRSGL